MKIHTLFASTAFAFVLSACGGGGSPSQPASIAGPGGTQTSTVTKAINPISDAADGASVSTVQVAAAPIGATVDLYAVMPDGTSGASLSPTQTNTKGSLTFTTAAPITGMIRLVSRGGNPVVRTSDNRYMPFGTLELVAPFVSNNENYFQISQI